MGLMGLFGRSKRNDKIKNQITDGAVIVDIRSPIEFLGGHIAGSINIPFPEIEYRIDEIRKMNKSLVLCGADEKQGEKAERYLRSKRVACENGGEWKKLKNLL